MPRGGHWGAEKSKKFGAQSLAETRVSNDQRWLELTFGELPLVHEHMKRMLMMVALLADGVKAGDEFRFTQKATVVRGRTHKCIANPS